MLRAILLTTALASGAGSAWLVGGMGAAETPVHVASAVVTPPVGMEEVLVAATALERGAKLTQEDVRWHPWPKDALTEALVRKTDRPEAPAELAGSVLRGSIAAGAPVAAGALAPAGSNLLSAVLSSGMRAVAIAISAEKTAGGFILPEDRVDIVVTRPCRDASCSDELKARTILRNVRVLAIDQSGGEANAEASLIGKTATLELSPAQAETLVGAEAAGTLSLVLRSSMDHAEEAEVVEQVQVPAATPVAAPQVVEQPRPVVRVWRNGTAEDVTL